MLSGNRQVTLLKTWFSFSFMAMIAPGTGIADDHPKTCVGGIFAYFYAIASPEMPNCNTFRVQNGTVSSAT